MKEIWLNADIYGIDFYDSKPTCRVMIGGDADEVCGPVDEYFKRDDIIESTPCFANDEFQGVCLVRGKMDEKGDIFFEAPSGESIRAGHAVDGKPGRYGQLPIADRKGKAFAHYVDDRRKAIAWAAGESEAASCVLKNSDLEAGADAKALRKEIQSYKVKQTVIDAVKGMHPGISPKP